MVVRSGPRALAVFALAINLFGCAPRPETELGPIVEAVLASIDTVWGKPSMLQGSFCPSLEACAATPTEALRADADSILETLARRAGIRLVFGFVRDLPLCPAPVASESPERAGYLVALSEPEFRTDDVALNVDVICAKAPGGAAYSRLDGYTLRRDGARWMVVDVQILSES